MHIQGYFINIFYFIVHSSIYLAFGGACLVYVSCLLFEVEPRIDLMFIAFLSIYSIYNANKITDKEEDKINVPDRVAVFKKYEKYLTISVPLAFLTAILLSYMISGIKMVIVVVFFLIIFILYGVKWIPKSISKYSRLKEMFIVKNIIASFAWAWIATFIPVVYYITVNSNSILIVFTLIFCLTFIDTLVFDMRDIEGDKINGIHTIPVFLGFYRTRTLLIFLNTFLGISILLFILKDWAAPLIYVISIVVLYVYLYLYLINKMEMDFLCDVIVDGWLISIGILTFLGRILF